MLLLVILANIYQLESVHLSHYTFFYFIKKFVIEGRIDRRIEERLIHYRSNRTNGFQDAVLVKDVGVSCNLLNKNAIEPDISISGVENYLVKQLKFEYNELSNITKKLNAYTKDILSSLASRCKRKDQVLEKLVQNLTLT